MNREHPLPKPSAAYEQLTICVFSAHRAGRVLTLDSLPPELLERTVLIVPGEEFRDYERQYGDRVRVCDRPDYVQNLPASRQWALEHVATTRAMLHLDDDLRFAARVQGTKLAPAGHGSVQRMVDTMLGAIVHNGFAHVGLSARAGNNRQPLPAYLLGRMYMAYMHDADFQRAHGLRWDRLVLPEDFDMTLQLLRMGRPNLMLYQWAVDQPASNSAGGVSVYRTPEVQAQGMRGLAALHPEFVTVVEKPARNWQGYNGTRTDVRVAWQKAYESAFTAAPPEMTTP